MSNLILRSLDVPAVAPSVLYTITPGKQGSLSVRFCNRTSSEIAVRLAIAVADAPTLAEYFEYDAKLPPNGVLENTGLLAPGSYRIVGYAALAGVSMNAWIYED